MESLCPGCGYPLDRSSNYHYWPKSGDRTTSLTLGKARLLCQSCNTVIESLYPDIGDVPWEDQKKQLDQYYSKVLKGENPLERLSFLLFTMFLYGREYTVLAESPSRGKSIIARQYRLETGSDEPIVALKAKTHLRTHLNLRKSKVEDLTVGFLRIP